MQLPRRCVVAAKSTNVLYRRRATRRRPHRTSTALLVHLAHAVGARGKSAFNDFHSLMNECPTAAFDEIAGASVAMRTSHRSWACLGRVMRTPILFVLQRRMGCALRRARDEPKQASTFNVNILQQDVDIERALKATRNRARRGRASVRGAASRRAPGHSKTAVNLTGFATCSSCGARIRRVRRVRIRTRCTAVSAELQGSSSRFRPHGKHLPHLQLESHEFPPSAIVRT